MICGTGCDTYELNDVVANVRFWNAEHHTLGQFARTDPVNTANLFIYEHILNHAVHGIKILWVIYKFRGTVLHKVVKSGQHIFEIELGTSLEGGMDQLKRLPHCWGN